MNSAMISLEFSQPSCSPRSSASCRLPMPIAERGEAEPVEAQLAVLPGLVHEHDEAEHGEDAERQIDQEHPVPGIGLGQPGAQRRSHDRAHHHAHAPDRHRLGAFMQRVGVEHHRLRQRHQGGAEHALQQAKQHHLVDVLRGAAQHRRDREAGGADDEDPLAAEPVGDPAHRRGHDRRRHDVGGQHPVDLVLRRRQAALHVGQRDVGDGGVQRLHDGRRHRADRHHGPAQAGNGNRALRPMSASPLSPPSPPPPASRTGWRANGDAWCRWWRRRSCRPSACGRTCRSGRNRSAPARAAPP